MDGKYFDIDHTFFMDVLLEENIDIAEILEETESSHLTLSSEYIGDITPENDSIESLEPSLVTISLDSVKSPIQNTIMFDSQNADSPPLQVDDISSAQTKLSFAHTSVNVSARTSPEKSPSSSPETSPSSSQETTTPSTVSETLLLPPCRVCGEKASGFHYGANTCEACKGFFRRCIVKIEHNEDEYRCSKSSKCAIVPGRRNTCSACRYKKCLSVGMSKHAIKTGRYTYAKKTKDTREIKRLQAVKKTGVLIQTNITEIEMITTVSRLVEIQRMVDPAKIFDKEFTLRKQKNVYKEYIDKAETFATVVSTELYDEILYATGIDLDDRKHYRSFLAEKYDSGLKNMMLFVKALPDMNDISAEDQTKLIKGSYAEYAFLAKHKMMNPDLQVYADPSSNEDAGFHRDEIMNELKNPNVDEFFIMARSLQNLDLTEEEVAVARGIVITFTDRYTLDQPDKIEQIQWKLIDCLRWMSHRSNKSPEIRVCRILDRLTALRNLTEMIHEMNKERMKWPIMQKYPLVIEVLNTVS